jgi:hypothetical protein
LEEKLDGKKMFLLFRKNKIEMQVRLIIAGFRFYWVVWVGG